MKMSFKKHCFHIIYTPLHPFIPLFSPWPPGNSPPRASAHFAPTEVRFGYLIPTGDREWRAGMLKSWPHPVWCIISQRKYSQYHYIPCITIFPVSLYSLYQGLLKCYLLDQEGNDIESGNLHVIPHIHLQVQLTWHIVSQISLTLFNKNLITETLLCCWYVSTT